jgi:predicted TIM-barrel fold metal-dependent hydrolase
MLIDINSHIIPAKYKVALYKVAPQGFYIQNVIDSIPTLYNLEHRFKIMDKFEGLMQVLTLSSPPVEEIAEPAKAVDLAKMANDEMAELVLKHPDRFAGAVACLPMNDMDATMKEVDRSINDLKFRGVQINTPTNDKPLDSPEFEPLFERMSQYNLPIWIHPMRNPDYADYRTEKASKYIIYMMFGWPYETATAMTRLVFSKILERYKNLKIITHHAGGIVPYLEQRIVGAHDNAEMLRGANHKQGLTMSPIEYFKMFYYDTALYGSPAALMCCLAFCGAEHMLFGTDFPFDNQFGERYTKQTIEAIGQMGIDDSDKKKIFEDNSKKIMRLPI